MWVIYFFHFFCKYSFPMTREELKKKKKERLLVVLVVTNTQ